MRVIDFHVHVFPNELAERAVARLVSGYQVTPSFDGTAAGMIRLMDEVGIEACVIVPVATKPSQVPTINDWAARIRSDRLIAFGAMHPEFPDPAAEIDRMVSMGIKGIKIHPNWQNFRPDDPIAFPIYEAMSGRMIALFHSGDELEPWPEILATPERMARVNDLFPDLKMVIAHMGGYRMWEEVRAHLIGRDVYFDVSACFPEDLPDDQLVSLMRDHGMDKIVWASDSPCGHPKQQLDRMLSLPLTDDEKELLFWKNATRLLGRE